MDIDSGTESDGKGALREVEAREEPKAARRGPGNESLKHYCDPTPVLDRSKQKRWEFRCRTCPSYVQFKDAITEKNLLSVPMNSTRTVARTIDGPHITFDMEPKLPKLQNLAGHAADCKGKSTEKIQDGPTSEEAFKLKKSVELMEAFLKEGELNPEIIATYLGFLRIFAAWIIDESLPWTTGEAPTLQMLFKYLKITYQLPSDTTVRNQLVHIFQELHGKVVREFTVRALSEVLESDLTGKLGR